MPKYSLEFMAKQRFAARNMLAELAKEKRMRVADIVGRARFAPIVEVRTEFIRRAGTLGMGSRMIGRIINRHATTVLHHRAKGAQDAG